MSMNKIPKTIHYCWFGRNSKSELIQQCIESWKEKLPDYKIIEWNEDNFDINITTYTKEAYESGKYAFVSDYARLWIINTHGGIYLDTDVEVIKNLDRFLDDKAFMGFEGKHGVNPGLIFGSLSNNKIIQEIMHIYENDSFIKIDGTYNIKTIVNTTTEILVKHGLILDCNKYQNVKGISIYPIKYFCPDKKVRQNKKYNKDTYTAHHYDASWVNTEYKKRLENKFWKFTFNRINEIGKLCRTILGHDKWENIRNRYFIKLYNFVRGQ